MSKLLIPLLALGAIAVAVGSASASESYADGPMPDELLSLQQQALVASINPNQVREVADRLRAGGYPAEADELESKAEAIDAMSDEEYAAFVGCALSSLGATPGTIQSLPLKGHATDTIEITIPTAAECEAYYNGE